MSTTTPNLSLVKPATTEQVDVSVLNSNFDAIDSGIPARLYNGTDTLYCKEGTTKGFLVQDNQIKVVPVTWNAGVPAVGTAVGYIDSTGNYHSSNYDLDTLGDSVSNTDYVILKRASPNSNNTINIVKRNNLCMFRIFYMPVNNIILNNVAWASNTICDIPDGYRPSLGTYYSLHTDQSGASFVIAISNNVATISLRSQTLTGDITLTCFYYV